MTERSRILGLDIGIGSCGWAVLDMESKEIVDMGVHLWDVPQENKTHESLAANRRAARSARRNTKRRADRAKHCLKILQKHKLVPNDAHKDWFQTVKGDPQPLESRVLALDSIISDRHFAQALYNICSRRGYIPHGEDSIADNTEGKKVLNAINTNCALMEEKGYRTVGEMMLLEGRAHGKTCGLSRNKGGDYSRCLTMEQLLAEVEVIFEAQRALGNSKATRELQEDFIACMTWEKDTAAFDDHIYSLVGPCIYLPEEKRGAKACLSFEQCIAFEKVSNVRIVELPDGNERALPAEARRWCIETLFSPMPLKGNKHCKVTYRMLREYLRSIGGITDDCVFKGINPEQETNIEIVIPKVWKLERSHLPQTLLETMLASRELADDIGSALAYSSSESTLRIQLESISPLSKADIEAICSLPFSSAAFCGYGNRSVTALQMLCDAFADYEQIDSLYKAEVACGLAGIRADAGNSKEKSHYLPPYIDYDADCKNPVFLRAMARVRRVVNAVISEYGMPTEVHIELGRELKHSEKEKGKIHKASMDREALHRASREKLAGDLGCDADMIPSALVRKYELWCEQNGQDLFSGAAIDYSQMIRDSSYCNICHILPYSRTCDDSQSNKVLTLSFNIQKKRRRTPYEWLDAEGKWEEFEARVARLPKEYSYKKRQKLLERNLGSKQEEFISRNLNDTHYVSKAAKGYIEHCLDIAVVEGREPVLAVASGATSALRYTWGITNNDECRSAVDAAVIAACDKAALMKVAWVSEKKHYTPKVEWAGALASTEPWEGFAKQIEETCESMVPTRRVEHGGSARLYEDTVYRYCGMNEKGNKAILRAKGKERASGNYVIREDGSVLKPDGMAFLRLWWDSSRKRFLKEPVYYADLMAIKLGEYVPRHFASNAPRCSWPIVPEEVLIANQLVVLRNGDCVSIGGEKLRFRGFNTANGTLKFAGMQDYYSFASPSNSMDKAMDASFIQVINEDVLGLCHKRKDREN